MSIFDRRRPYRALRRLLGRIYNKQGNAVQELGLSSGPAGTGGITGDGGTGSGGTPADQILDQDGDTFVHTEQSEDEDKVRFTTAGTERMVLDAGNCDISGAFSGRFKADDTTNSASITMSSRSGGASKPGISAGGTNIPLRLGTDSRIGVMKISEQHDQITLGGDLSDSTDFGCRLVIGTGSGDTRPALGIKESATTPGATSGIGKVYIKSTDSTKLFFKDEAGTETDLTAGGGGGDPDQNLWETVSSDSGSAVANITTDTLTIAGGTGISTAVSGDTLTITNDSPSSPTTTQALTTAKNFTLSAGNTSQTEILFTGTAEAGKKIASTHFPFTLTAVGSGRGTLEIKWQEFVGGTTWTDITNSSYTVDNQGLSVGGIASSSVADDVDTNLRIVVVGTYTSGTSLTVDLTAGVVSILTP